MKKIIFIALTICIIISGCGINSSDPSSNKGSDSSTGSTSTEAPKASVVDDIIPNYQLKFSDKLANTNNANFNNGGYIAEDERFIFYRNGADNGYLYRYDKQTNSAKVLFNANTHYCLVSIKLYKNLIYFIATTKEDTSPTLYSIDINGNGLTKVLGNVGYYILTDEYICFTTNPENSDGALYKYNWNTKKSELMLNNKLSEEFTLVGDYIYFIDYINNGQSATSGSDVLSKINIKTNKCEVINIRKNSPIKFDLFNNIYYYNNKLYFIAYPFELHNPSFCSYDLNTKKVEVITSLKDLLKNKDASKAGLWAFCVLGNNDFVFDISGPDYAIIELKNGETIVHDDYDDKISREFMICDDLLMLENKPVAYVNQNEPTDKIIGTDKLNIKIDTLID